MPMVSKCSIVILSASGSICVIKGSIEYSEVIGDRRMGILNFVIAGAQRSATTSLKQAMAEHPGIGFLSNREDALSHNGCYVGYPFATPFFSKSFAAFAKGKSVYESISRSAGDVRYIGTKWPYFMIWPHIACNMRQHLPGLRLVFILRNPMDCLWSSFKKSYKGESLHDDFSLYVRTGLEAIEEGWREKNRNHWPHMLFDSSNEANAIDRGFYYPQLMNFILLFGWAQVYVMNYVDFALDPKTSMDALFTWMGLEPVSTLRSIGKKHNAANEHAPDTIARASMDPRVRKELAAFYEPSNRRLCESLAWDYERWIAG